MAKVNYGKLLKIYESQPERAPALLRESFEAGDLKPTDFDLGALFTECFGWHEFNACRKDRQQLATKVMEAAGGVSTAAFAGISGQIVYRSTIQAYEDEDFAFTKVIPEEQSPYTFEKIAGITRIGDEIGSTVVGEGQMFPIAGVGQTWINLPETQKRGEIVPVTREAVFFDRTGQLLERCREVGYWYGFNRELRAINVVIDENTGAKSAAVGGHRYHWRDVSIATYGDNTGTHTWDNLSATTTLLDWTSVDAAEQLLNQMVDPDTGAPIVGEADTLICTKQNQKIAQRIVHATSVSVHVGGYAATGNLNETFSPSPIAGNYNILSTRLLKQQMTTATTWYLGKPSKAFVYVVNFPFQTIQAPPNSEAEFNRDIVMQFRADERGNYGTKEPRLMIKCTV